MKRSEIPSRTTIPLPFAFEGETDVGIPDIDPLSGGFDANYQWNDTTKPIKFITRPLVNKLFGQMSGNQFLRQCGALNTFDQRVCETIGGYPQGAVLEYLEGNILYDVVSLHDGNVIDFNKNGIDNVNWKFYGSSMFTYIYPDYGSTGVDNIYEFEINTQSSSPYITPAANQLVVGKTCFAQVFADPIDFTDTNAENVDCGIILYSNAGTAISSIPDPFDEMYTQYEVVEIGSATTPIFPILGGTRIAAFLTFDVTTGTPSVGGLSIKIRFLTPSRTR